MYFSELQCTSVDYKCTSVDYKCTSVDNGVLRWIAIVHRCITVDNGRYLLLSTANDGEPDKLKQFMSSYKS